MSGNFSKTNSLRCVKEEPHVTVFFGINSMTTSRTSSTKAN